MERRLVFSNALKGKLDCVGSSTKEVWRQCGISDTNGLMEKIIGLLNDEYPKLNIAEFVFRQNLAVYGESSTYFGVLEVMEEGGDEGEIEAYVFMIPPKYETRSGVLAQQVFPVLSGMMPFFQNSNDYKLSNRPIYIVNANEVNQTAAMAVNIICGQILDFRYIDIFNRDLHSVLSNRGFNGNITTIKQLDELLTDLNKTKENDFFRLDEQCKTIEFLIVRLKDGIRVNNEPYWFVLKAYAAVYLALRESYGIDMAQFNTLARGNKTLDSFRDYIKRFG